jgi:hypothetical protein
MHKNIVPRMVLICFASFPTTSLHAAEAKDCQLKQYASLDISGPRNGYLLIPVTIQESHAFMILNTASAFSSITEDAASRLGLQINRMPFGAEVRAGKKPIEKVATAKGFSLGNVGFKSADFLVISNETLEVSPVDERVIGTLGMDVFAHVDVELDVSNRKMNLFSQDHCPGRAVYWSKTYDSVPIRFGELGEFYFPMELDGKKLETTLATGNPTTSLFTDATKKLYNFDKDSPDVETETDITGRTTAHYRAMKLSAEGIDIINAHVQLIDLPSNTSCYLSSHADAASYNGCLGRHPLQLGRSVLTKLRIYIATKEKVLYFTPSGVADQG